MELPAHETLIRFALTSSTFECEGPDEKKRFGNRVFNVRPAGGNLPASENVLGSPGLLFLLSLLLLLLLSPLPLPSSLSLFLYTKYIHLLCVNSN